MLYIDTSTYTCVCAFVLDNGICRESQKPPGAPLQQPGKRTQAARNARAGQERPRAARSSQERSAAARAATSSTRASAQTRSRSSPRRPQEAPGSPRKPQEAPGQPRNSPGAAQWPPEAGRGEAQEWPRSGPAAASTANGYPYMKDDNIHEIRFMQDTRHTKRLKHENHMFQVKIKNMSFRRLKTINPNMDINMMLSRPMPLKCHFHVCVRYSYRYRHRCRYGSTC